MGKVDELFSKLPAGFFALCTSRDLGRTPLRQVFSGIAVVLFRDAHGRAKALLDRCPHRGVPLSEGCVIEGTLRCPYHGYRFDGAGACVELPGLTSGMRIPRAMCTPSLNVVEQDGFVWVEAKRWGSETSPPRLPFKNDAAYHSMIWSLSTYGSVIDGLENFLDATHTHYVHAGLIRRARGRRRVDVHVTREGGVAEARYVDSAEGRSRSTGLISRLLARDIDGRYGRFIAPCIAQLEYKRGRETAMVISALFTPRTERELSVWAVVTTRRVPLIPSPLVQGLIRPLFAMAIRQDRRMLELQAEAQRMFGVYKPVPSPTDVLRPHIEFLLTKGPSQPFAKDLSLEI